MERVFVFFLSLMCLSEVHRLVEFGRADDGDGFRQHQLVGAVSVKINAGEEGRLSRVSLKVKEEREGERVKVKG